MDHHPGPSMTMHERVTAVLSGRPPDRIPFISRLDFWQRGLAYQGQLPEAYRGLSLAEIHRAVGLGQEEWLCPCARRYRQLELVMTLDGEEIRREYEPVIQYFPDLWGMVPIDRAGETVTRLISPAGTLECRHRLSPESLGSGTSRPQMVHKPVKTADDYRIYETILEHSELVTQFDAFQARSRELGEQGYLVPQLNRVPFQSLLIDAIGEAAFFYALHDDPQAVDRLLRILDEQTVEMLESLAGLDVPYIEFCDNLEGSMTNPRLFRQYVAPAYQRYSEILHRQGKKLGSHTDGNLKKLVNFLPGSGLDVCESFTPAPITECTFEEAWAAWQNGPLIWGGIPSYYLEPRIPRAEFEQRIEELLALVGSRPVILGIADAVMSDNDIERVGWIAARIEATTLSKS